MTPQIRTILGVLMLTSVWLPPELAEAQLETRVVDEWDTRLTGVRHLHRHGVDSSGIQQSIHVAVVDLGHPDVQVQVVNAEGSETALDLARRVGGTIAVDGDYPRDGVAQHPERSALVLGGVSRIARFEQARGPSLGGGPRFMRDGRWLWEDGGTQRAPRINEESFPEEAWAWDTGRQPHTVVALADQGRTLILLTCDGRGAGGAGGCRLRADVEPLLRELGASDAMKLAGGPWTTFVFDGAIINHPSDPRGARPLANALVVRAPRSALPAHTRQERVSAPEMMDAGVDAMTPDASALPVEPQGCSAGGSSAPSSAPPYALALLALVFVRRRR